MTDSLYDLADPFHGNDTTALPHPEGLAAAWFWPKAQTGNTHPGACAGFGRFSALPYSGAYVTGYGCNGVSTGGPPAKVFPRKTATGITHIHHSGTGMTEAYGNILRVVPLAGGMGDLPVRWDLTDEYATPGRYAAVLAPDGITVELTAAPRGVVHRYTFPTGCPTPTLAVDLTSGGLLLPGMRQPPEEVELLGCDDHSATGRLMHRGLECFFCVRLRNRASLHGLWEDNRSRPGETLHRKGLSQHNASSAGVYWTLPDRSAELAVGLSFADADDARAITEELSAGFDGISEQAEVAWREALGRIRITGGSDIRRSIFASCLYHSLVKPTDWGNASPFWPGRTDPFFLDFATLWDQYKTHLPLINACYPNTATKIVNAMLAQARHWGTIPIGLQFDNDLHRFSNQARCLAHLAIVDAWDRGLTGVDWHDALDLLVTDLRSENNEPFFRDGLVKPATHTLDLACACHATARLAECLGRGDLAESLSRNSTNWRKVYDPQTGLLTSDSTYYEGTHWNYSFRPLPQMADRIALAGGADVFCDLLERFFGYDAPPVRQPAFEGDRDAHRAGMPLGRFEGLNNEPDMETPWMFCFAGRHDRTAEVLRAILQYSFAPGPGGLPGNDDSGGLSSWYVWAAAGLLPLPGEGRCILGSGIFETVEFDLPAGPFRIEWRNTSDGNRYITAADLDGQPLRSPFLPYSAFRAGSTLHLQLAPNPNGWGNTGEAT